MQISSNIYGHFGYGCCDAQVPIAKDKSVYSVRSMEYPVSMETQINVFNRDETYVSTAPDGSPGVSWVNPNGYVGFCGFDMNRPDEGLNEKGLSCGFLTLQCSQYQTVSNLQTNQALALMDVGSWILGNFSTVEEVKESLKNVRIWGNFIKIMEQIPKLHIALHDANGNNLVIEFINGEVQIHDNPYGILTNDPPFKSQLANLGQYNHLSPEPAPDVTINGGKLGTTHFACGLVGLPGDPTSESRFVRIGTVVRTVLQPNTAMDSLITATHILNTVDIPEGMVAATVMGQKVYDTTRWATIKDHSNKILYYRSYNDLALRAIDLTKINFAKGTVHQPLVVQASLPTIIDVTDNLKV